MIKINQFKVSPPLPLIPMNGWASDKLVSSNTNQNNKPLIEPLTPSAGDGAEQSSAMKVKVKKNIHPSKALKRNSDENKFYFNWLINKTPSINENNNWFSLYFQCFEELMQISMKCSFLFTSFFTTLLFTFHFTFFLSK